MAGIVKPIVVVKIETRMFLNEYLKLQALEHTYQEKFKEYYVLCVPIYKETEEPVSLEVFYSTGFTNIHLDKLKEYISSIIDEIAGDKEAGKPLILASIKEKSPNTQAAMKWFEPYGSYNKFAVDTHPWKWNDEKLNSMTGAELFDLNVTLIQYCV